MIPDAVKRAVSPYAPAHLERIDEPSLGLCAYIVLHSTSLGPAAGGVRTTAYGSESAAAEDACRLARAMTYKCALGGLNAGGGKAVVMKTDALDREAAFRRMGDRVEALGGAFRTAGDLGTTAADLAAMASRSGFVHTDTPNLAGAVGQGVLRCMEACAEAHGEQGVAGLTVAVQGCGDIGAAVAHALRRAGAQIFVADLDRERAESLAAKVDGEVVSPDDILWLDVDIVAPCAIGDVLDGRRVERMKAWAICGGANNICADAAAHRALHDRGILFVPDLISSAGAVIEGIGETVMGLDDRSGLIDALRETAAAVLHDAAQDGRPPMVHAIERAQRRIDAAPDLRQRDC